jgi:hypothetical protein
MPQPFDHPSVQHTSSDDRSYDELRRDAELGLDTLKQAIARTKQEGPSEHSQWAVTRVRSTLDKMRKSRDGDMIVTNRLTAEVAQLDGELKRAEKSWLLANSNARATQRSSEEDPLRDPDEDRARLLRAQQTLSASDRLIDDIERNVGQSVRLGEGTQVAMEEQGQDLLHVRTEVSRTGQNARAAAGVLRKMAERAFYNRLFLWFIILMLVTANTLFIYFGFIKK